MLSSKVRWISQNNLLCCIMRMEKNETVEDCVTLFEFTCRIDVWQETDNKMQLSVFPDVSTWGDTHSCWAVTRSQRIDKENVRDLKVSKKCLCRIHVITLFRCWLEHQKHFEMLWNCFVCFSQATAKAPFLAVLHGWRLSQSSAMSCPYSLIDSPLCVSVSIRNIAETFRLCPSYSCSS